MVIRIGLKIDHPDETSEKFCYLLSGLEENISINEFSKPVIFDEFTTQLNAYNCTEVTEENLVIPSKVLNDEDPIENTDGDSARRSVSLGDPTTINIPLPDGLEPVESNGVVGVTSSEDGQSLYIMKSKTRDLETGNEFFPIYALNLADGSLTEQVRLDLGNLVPATFEVLPSGYAVAWGASWTPRVEIFDSEGASLDRVEVLDGRVGGSPLQKLLWVGDEFFHFSGSRGRALTTLNLEGSDLVGSTASWENPPSEGPWDIAALGEDLFVLSGDQRVLRRVNTNLVVQEEIEVSRFLKTKAE